MSEPLEQEHCGENLMELAVDRGDTACIEAVVEALLAECFSRASVLLHLKRALLALHGKPRHHQLFLELLLQLPLLELHEVELGRDKLDNETSRRDWIE
jgi:hypothetical protein